MDNRESPGKVMLDPDTLPVVMRSVQRWLVWRLEPNADQEKKPRKVPYYTNGSRRGATDTEADLAMLATFEDALRVFQNGRFTGLGFALGPDGSGNCWQGIDLDDMPIRPGLHELSTDLPGYTEVSPSGNGMHAIGYGRAFPALGSNATGIEAYASGRYFTVTGEGSGLHPPVCLADFVENRLKPIHQKASDAGASSKEEHASEFAAPKTITELRSALAFMPADDYELWVAMGYALKKLGAVGHGLWVEWSQKSTKYKPLEAEQLWELCNPTKTGDFATGYSAVFKAAQKRGWVNPLSKAAQGDKGIPPGSGEAETDPAKPRYKVLSADDVQNMPPLQWLVRGVVPAQGLACMYGASGSGKSFLALDMGAAVAEGAEWFDCRVTAAPVVYVALEGEHGFRQRVKAWQAHQRRDLPIALRFVMQPFDLRSADDLAQLAEAVTASGCAGGLLVIDTLNRAASGADENTSKDMGEIIDATKMLQSQLGGTVLLIHHSGKDQTKGLRGHSSLHAALDAAIEVTRINDRREWNIAKSKDDGDSAAFPFRLEVVDIGEDEQGDRIASCAIVPGDRTEAIKRVKLPSGPTQKIAHDTLSDLLRSATTCGKAGAPPLRPCVELEAAVLTVADRLPCRLDARNYQARRAITAMCGKGMYQVREGWIWDAQ